MVAINQKMNLVVSVETDGGLTAWVHSTPISPEVFRSYYLVIAKAFSVIYGEGLSVVAGPRVAAMTLEQVARDMSLWEGPGGVSGGLMAEIRRLSNITFPSAQGWVSYPLQEALDKKMITPDDISEVENAIAFFILNSAMLRRSDLMTVLGGMSAIWGAETTLLDFTAFTKSLLTQTTPGGTGTKDAADLSQKSLPG